MTTTTETKAQRIFKQTYREVRDQLAFGVEFDAMSGLCCNDNDTLCRRTINAVLAECDKCMRDLKNMVRFECITLEEGQKRAKAVKIVRHTCENWIADEAAFEAHHATL